MAERGLDSIVAFGMPRRLRGVAGLLVVLCAWVALQAGLLTAGEQPTAQEKRSNPTRELEFQGGQPWTNGIGANTVAAAPQLQLDAARKARADNREFIAAEKYFELARVYPEAPQTVAGLLEVSNLLLDLGYPSKAAFSMDQVLKRGPAGTLERYDVQLPALSAESSAGAIGRQRGDLAPVISRLEASVGLTLLEAYRLGYSDQTPGIFSFWPFSLFRDEEDCNPYYSGRQALFGCYGELDLQRQFSKMEWIPGRGSLRPVIVYAYDAKFYAERHLNAMVAYDPLSYDVFSGYFHRGRLKLERDDFQAAIADFSQIQLNYGEATSNRNYPANAIEIMAFADMYTAWSILLFTPQVWKDRRADDRARTKLQHARDILARFSLLQLQPVVEGLEGRLEQRLARRYLRMADFYDRNDAPAAGDLMRFYLREAAPATEEAASTLDLFPWRSDEFQPPSP